MALQREHRLQAAIHSWVAHNVTESHEFMAFDRAPKASVLAHVHQKNRGIQSGTPDTLLVLRNRPPIWVEIKTPGNRPTPIQEALGASLRALGHTWLWATSVTEYAHNISAEGVALRPNWAIKAEDFDRRLAAKEMAPGRRYKEVREKPSVARVRATEAVRGRIPF